MKSRSESGNRIFVAWDMQDDLLRINLQGLLRRNDLQNLNITVPGLGPESGHIMNELVLKRIIEADRVLILIDHPNANVGFEAGLSWGLGKQILLAYFDKNEPSWIEKSPFLGYLYQSLKSISDLEKIIMNDDYWKNSDELAPPLPRDGSCLHLCRSDGIGEAFRIVPENLQLNDWIYPEQHSKKIILSTLNRYFENSARIVWTIGHPEKDERDGALNTANAVIAGWFYSRFLGNGDVIDDDGHDMPFWVLRQKSTRKLVDLLIVDQPFKDLDDYEIKIQDIEETWDSRPKDSSTNVPVDETDDIFKNDEDEDDLICLAVLPFENLSDHGDGESFSKGLTDDLIKGLDENQKLKIVPNSSVMTIGRRRLGNEEAAALLKAKYIVRGTLTQKGDYCLVEVRLFREGNSKPRRSYRRRHKWEDVLNNSVPEQIIKEISNGVKRSLSFDIKLPKHDNRAKELYWKGLQELDLYNNTRNPVSAEKARQRFYEAILKDGTYEEARIQIGFLKILRWETIGDSQLLKESLEVWHDVLDKNSNDPVALAETGYINFLLERNPASALDYVYKALESRPDHILANNVLALLYLYLGYYESNIKLEKEKVIVADPAYVYPLANAALAYQLMGRYEDALAMAIKAQDIDPDAFIALVMSGAQCFYLKNFEEANSIWQKGYEEAEAEIKPVFEILTSWIMAEKGDQLAASFSLSPYRNSPWINGAYGPYYISLCALCGKADEAIERLENTSTFAASYRYLISEPTLISLAGNQRFQELLEKRYSEWEANLRIFGEKLPVKPPELPTPSSFLEKVNSK